MDATTAAQQRQRPWTLDCEALPALLGVDPRRGRWSLWEECMGRSPPAGRDEGIEAAALPVLVEWLVRTGRLGPGARLGKGLRESAPLRLRGAVHAVIAAGSPRGEGPGIVRVEWMEARQWYREWEGNGVYPKAPPAVRAVMEGWLMLTGARWGLVVAQIGVERRARELPVHPDRDLANQITREIEGFVRSLHEGRPPEPDARADEGCLQRLAELCERTRPEPAVVEEDRAARARPLLQAAVEAEAQAARAQAQARRAEDEARRAGLALAQAIGADERPVALDGHVVRPVVDALRVAAPPQARGRIRIESERR